MTVVEAYVAGTHYEKIPKLDALPINIHDLLVESIALNTAYTSLVEVILPW